MSESYIGEIRIFPWNWAPVNWAQCNGQIVLISQYQALFAVIGTTYGGNGETNFALPNMAGCAPIGQGAGGGLTPRYLDSAPVGEENVALTSPSFLPPHTHSLTVLLSGDPSTQTQVPTASTMPAVENTALFTFNPGPVNSTMASAALATVGQSLPHSNQQPYLTLNFCICCYGLYPTPAN